MTYQEMQNALDLAAIGGSMSRRDAVCIREELAKLRSDRDHYKRRVDALDIAIGRCSTARIVSDKD